MALYKHTFTNIFINGYNEEIVNYKLANNTNFDFTGVTEFEMEIGKSRGNSLAAPGLILSMSKRDIVIGEPTANGLITYRFFPARWREAKMNAALYQIALFRTINGNRRSFGYGTLDLVGAIAGA